MKYMPLLRRQINEFFRDVTSFGSLSWYFLVIIIVFFVDIQQFFTLISVVILVEFLGAVIKAAFHKVRPDKQSYSNLFEKIDAGSFPSIHAARALVLWFGIAPLFSYSIIRGILLAFVLLVGLSRIYLKKHYLVDVICGYLLALLCWYGIGLVL